MYLYTVFKPVSACGIGKNCVLYILLNDLAKSLTNSMCLT